MSSTSLRISHLTIAWASEESLALSFLPLSDSRCRCKAIHILLPSFGPLYILVSLTSSYFLPLSMIISELSLQRPFASIACLALRYPSTKTFSRVRPHHLHDPKRCVLRTVLDADLAEPSVISSSIIPMQVVTKILLKRKTNRKTKIVVTSRLNDIPWMEMVAI